MTLTYCFILIGTYKSFPFTCQNLSENSQQFIDIVSQPFKLGMQEVSNIKGSVSNFLENNKIRDLVRI